MAGDVRLWSLEEEHPKLLTSIKEHRGRVTILILRRYCIHISPVVLTTVQHAARTPQTIMYTTHYNVQAGRYNLYPSTGKNSGCNWSKSPSALLTNFHLQAVRACADGSIALSYVSTYTTSVLSLLETPTFNVSEMHRCGEAEGAAPF